jgi:hypothetical protein
MPDSVAWKRYNLQHQQGQTYSGLMKGHARKRLRTAIDLLVQRSETKVIWNPVSNTHHDFKMAFVTLTQPNDRLLKAKDCYTQLLKPFLQSMRRRYGLQDYVWKFEFQQNGQGHYHIAVNQFFHYSILQDIWNKQLRAAGQLDGFARRYGHFKPNSTDVHSMVNVQDVESYLSKEFLKGVQNQVSAGGKWWDCSDSLHRKRFADVMDSETEALLWDGMQHGFCEILDLERCKVIKTDCPQRFLSPSLLRSYKTYIQA